MKIKLLAGFLIWFFVFENTVFAQWQTIFKDSLKCNFTSLYFLNNDTGFVAGPNLIPFFQGGTILRTLNGGQTWDTSFISEYPVAINFINDSVGFSGGENGSVYSTNNMGQTWSFISQFLNYDYTSIYFLNNQIGYFCADDDGLICKTIDGGYNWQIIYTSLGESYFPGSSKFFFIDSLTGYLAQATHDGWQAPSYDGRTIAKTINGGLTWIDLNIPFNFYPYSCYFFDSLSGFAVGKYGYISKTIDGGFTWSNPDSIGPYPLYDIYFVNNSIGYIIGGNNLYELQPPNGIIYKTINGGITWHVLDSNYFDGLNKMYFPSDSVGYAVGMNGIILKISNANSISSSVQLVSPNKNQFLISPNPTTDKIYISFPSTTSENVTTKIFSITGEVVFAEENKTATNYFTKTIDVKDFSNGIYFLSVRMGRDFTTKKIVVQH